MGTISRLLSDLHMSFGVVRYLFPVEPENLETRHLDSSLNDGRREVKVAITDLFHLVM